jgi:hypothetical protein
MNLPYEIQKYKDEQMAYYGRNKIPPRIKDNWDKIIIPSNFYSLGEDGAYAYLKRRRMNERNLIYFAMQADRAGYPEMGNGFWTRAYQASKAKDYALSNHSGVEKRMSLQPLKVFLCHSSGDKPTVRKLYHQLRNDGFSPWLDEEDLIPGQNWRQEISKAVKQSDVVLVCLSKTSINKIGFVQREIKYALDVAEEMPDGLIYIIPVKFEECEIPESLRKWQWVNLHSENGYQRLIVALNKRASTVNL